MPFAIELRLPHEQEFLGQPWDLQTGCSDRLELNATRRALSKAQSMFDFISSMFGLQEMGRQERRGCHLIGTAVRMSSYARVAPDTQHS
jgi:hypothetical protein